MQVLVGCDHSESVLQGVHGAHRHLSNCHHLYMPYLLYYMCLIKVNLILRRGSNCNYEQAVSGRLMNAGRGEELDKMYESEINI